MSAKYDPPYTAQQMREHGYSEDVIKKLENDPAHSWRMKTGIELIHREPTKTELMRIWKNWQLMTDDMKKKSDAKCKELFGVTNEHLYNYLLPQYKTDRPENLKETVKYPSNEELSEEALAEKAIKDGYLYHGSPDKYTVLKPQPQRDVNGKAALSLSPFKSTASLFIIPFNQLKPQGYRNCNWRVSEWFDNRGDRYKVTKTAHVYHNIKELGTVEKDFTGYLYTVKAEEALKECSDNPKWTCNAEVLSYVPEIHPVKTEEIKVHVVLEYNLEKCGVTYNASKESNEDFKANIKNNLVYHGSPRKLDKLAASASTTADAQGSVCVTPCKALAYCFAIDKDAVLGAVEKQFARRVLKCNFGYDIWNKPVSELYKVPQNITIELNIRGIKPIHGKSVGYIYTVDFNKYKDKCHMYHDSDVEIIINSDVDYIKREKVEVNWTCVSSELAIKRFGEGQLGTSDLGRESGEEGYKPGQMKITDIKSIDDLKAFYKTVKYGFRESDQDAVTKWRLSTYRYLLHHPVGVCYDTAVMSDHFLTQWNIKHMMLFMYADINKGWENTPTHMTVIYQDPNDKLYKWLEGSWSDFKNNNWAEKDPRVLVKNIAKAHANSCHHPVKIGAVEKAPLDGTCMIEFYNQVRSQCDHHLLDSVEPDKQNAEEDLKADLEQTNTQFKEISNIDDAWWNYITEAVNLAAEASGDEKWTKQEVKDKITKNNIKVYALIQERYLPGKGRHFAEYFSLVGMSQFTPSTMHISNVAVMPKFQGKGFGKHLIRATIDKIRSEYPNKDIFINVATKNSRAKSLYEKVGFKEISAAENSIKMVLKADAPAMESFLDTMLSEEGLASSTEALTRNITNYLNIGCHAEIKSVHSDWEKEAAFKVTEFFQNEKSERSTLHRQILSRIKLPSEEFTDATSTIEVKQYDRSQLGPIARSIYEFYVKYIVRCNVFTQKLAQLYFDNHANEDWAHDVRIQQVIEQYNKNLLSEEQIINYAPYIVKEYGPVELKSAFDLIIDDYVGNYLSKLESTRRSSMFAYPDYWDPSRMPEFALVFYLAELTVMHHTSDLYNSALISYNVQDEQSEKALDMYGEMRELATCPQEVSTEGLQGKEELPDSVKGKFGEYLYHGTHRDLDIKQLAVHFCKNRANTEIKAPVVYMTRSLGLASLHCAQFMKGHASKKTDYKEHFVELDKAIDSNEIIKHVEIVHNDPDLEEASGENDGFIYCTKKENCVDKLYFSTPKKKNDYLFVSYSPLPVDKKIKIHITWHRKYDAAFANSVKKEKYAGVEALEYIPTINDIASTEESPIMDAGKYYIVKGFPVYPFFARLKRYYNSTKLENLVTIVRSIGISSWFANTRIIKIHKFYIPELIFLLDKFGMAPNIITSLQKETWLGDPPVSKTNCDINRVYSNMNCTLYPHQEKFIKEYAEHKDSHKLRGYLLSFSQGLGKTITSVALMEALGKERVVVICPKNTMVETWKSHFQRFYKKEQSIYVAGVDKEFKGQRFCIFNYDAIDKMNSMAGVKTANMGVIVDESHNFLRMQSSRTQKLINLAKESDKTDMLLMSGTPIKACGVEMIPMLSILDPMFDDEAATIFKLAFGTSVKIATDVLNARIHCIMERVTKDVLDLPPKTRTTIKIQLPDGQKYTVKEVRKGMEQYIRTRLSFHRDHMVEYRQEFDECMKYLNNSPIASTPEFKKYKVILNRLIHDRGKFNQGDAEVSWMNQYEKTVVEKQLPPPLLQKFRHSKAAIKYLHLKVRGEVLGQYLGKLRIEMTSAMLQKANLKQLIDAAQKKTIIFTSFVDTIETCEKYVRNLGYKPIVIYGKNSGEIAPLAKVFQTDMSVNPLIASLQTLSTGATLTAANRVIFLNKPWRSVDYEQASDRVHRIGQDAPVDIISLVLDTGEQGNLSTRMEDIMDASARAFDAIVEEHKEQADRKKGISREDFYLPKDVLDECKYGEKYMTYTVDLDTSVEGMTLLHDTHEQRVLNRMAKPHYRPAGANSWEHVQQDIANAIMMVKKIKHRKLTLQEYATILYHDCACKSMYPEKDSHGIRGTKIAKPDLRKCGFFSEKQIEEICVAILEHDETTNPQNLHSSELSDLLASADTNPIDIPWQLNKSYVWGIRHGLDHKARIKNTVEHMPSVYGSKGNMVYPKLYKEFYKSNITKMQKFYDSLTVEQCEKIIMEYRVKHRLKQNEISLPEPNTDEIVISNEEKSVFTAQDLYKDISFPQEEIPTISKQDRIITTRVSKDFSTFLEGDMVKTPWGAYYRVSKRLVIHDVKKHPFYNKLTQEQIDTIKQYKDIAVLCLDKIKPNVYTLDESGNKVKVDLSSEETFYTGTYYRVTYDGEGVYQALKKVLKPEEWKKFLEESTWLKKPTIEYTKNCHSYFTAAGYEAFLKNTMPYILKYLDKSKMTVIKRPVDESKIVYSDRYQIVIDYSKKSSNESLSNEILLSNTAEQVKLNKIAKPYYEPNKWKHVQQDVTNGVRMAKKVENRDLTLQEYASILFHDSACKAMTERKGHGVKSAEIAKKELSNLNYFDNKQVEEICVAIREHDSSFNKEKKYSSKLSDFLMSSDSDPIDIPWIMNKYYVAAKGHGLSHDECIKYLSKSLPEYYGTNGKLVYPNLYREYYKDKIKEMNQFFDHVTPDQIEQTIAKYRKSHNLGENDTRLPDPSYENLDVSFSTELLESSMEKADIQIKRKKIQDYILKAMRLLDPHTNVNVDYWKKKFDTMSDKDFDNFMHNLREGKENIHMYVPPFKVKLQNKELINAAHALGVKLMHRLWMKDAHTGIKYLTPEEYMVLQLPVRRQQQFLDEKLSVPDNDKTIDGLTGQVAGDSKTCSFTTPEIQIFHVRNLDTTIFEMANVRGGNINNYAEFKRSLEETGEVSLNQLDPMNRTRVAVIGQVFLTAMHLDVNLVDI